MIKRMMFFIRYLATRWDLAENDFLKPSPKRQNIYKVKSFDYLL